jgi:Zn-dependent peptidase ImmA (M78 family)
MHELAHIICKHTIPEEYKNIPIPFGMRHHCEEHEEEAKYLGGCLQITRAGLLWVTKKSMTIEEIANYYNATVDMVKYRLNVSGVSKQRLFTKK